MGPVAFLRVRGVDSATAAQALRDEYVYVRAADAQPPPDGCHYWHRVIGLEVVTTEGHRLGEVEEILQTGANDVYVVRTPDGGEVLVPAIDEIITAIDTSAGTITVELMPGLID